MIIFFFCRYNVRKFNELRNPSCIVYFHKPQHEEREEQTNFSCNVALDSEDHVPKFDLNTLLKGFVLDILLFILLIVFYCYELINKLPLYKKYFILNSGFVVFMKTDFLSIMNYHHMK